MLAIHAAGFLVVSYFTYHAVAGERGMLAVDSLRADLARSEARLAALANERAELQAKTELLRSEHIDPDMLDERVRAMLNYTHPDEIVIPLERDEAGRVLLDKIGPRIDEDVAP